jgi:small subunit ribosomal protein S21e
MVFILFLNYSSATNKVITSKDHAAVQINIGEVDQAGHLTKNYTTVVFCGDLRKNGNSDGAFNEICLKKKIMKDV